MNGLIPLPSEVQVQDGDGLPLGDELTVTYDQEGLRPAAEQLCDWITRRWGVTCTAEPRSSASGLSGSGSGGGGSGDASGGKLLRRVSLQLRPQGVGGGVDAEAYAIEAPAPAQGEAAITAATLAGACRGAATLLQLTRRASGEGDALPALLRVSDAPAWRWRGVLVDVGRHYYSPAFLRKALDAMALLKMNVLHWHLTEDQGWRIEVKRWPRLTEVGAWRGEAPLRAGGFYTQDEVRDIVAYAAARGIHVVPEIELPGHCCAALAAYPHLSCTGAVTRVPTQWGIHEDVYCAGKDEVFEFLESVLSEVTALFPFEYVHIGGDECPKARWRRCADCQRRIKEEGLSGEDQLQSWFISRIARHLAKLGKRIIGWDEILEGGLPEGATVMSWRGTEGGVIAARAGHDAIMTPTSHCYFDYRQGPSPSEPGAWYACLPLEVVYSFDPLPSPDGGVRAPGVPCDGGGGGPRISCSSEPGFPAQQPGGVFGGGGGGGGDGGGAPQRHSFAGHEQGGRQSFEALPPPEQQQQQQQQQPQQQQQQQRDCEGRGDHVPGQPPAPPAAAQQQPPTHEQGAAAAAAGGGGGGVDRARILGGQANLWTEYVPDEATAEYMLLPRLCAMAEALWTPAEARSWPGFRRRLAAHMECLAALGFRPRALDGEV